MTMDRPEFTAAFRAKATKLNGTQFAYQWWKSGINPEKAAEWANAGYQPDKALPLIAYGMTPELAGEASAAVLGHGD